MNAASVGATRDELEDFLYTEAALLAYTLERSRMLRV